MALDQLPPAWCVAQCPARRYPSTTAVAATFEADNRIALEISSVYPHHCVWRRLLGQRVWCAPARGRRQRVRLTQLFPNNQAHLLTGSLEIQRLSGASGLGPMASFRSPPSPRALAFPCCTTTLSGRRVAAKVSQWPKSHSNQRISPNCDIPAVIGSVCDSVLIDSSQASSYAKLNGAFVPSAVDQVKNYTSGPFVKDAARDRKSVV